MASTSWMREIIANQVRGVCDDMLRATAVNPKGVRSGDSDSRLG